MSQAFAFLQGAPHIPPGEVPLARRAAALRVDAATRLEEEALRRAEARRETVKAELPRRRERIGINFEEMTRMRISVGEVLGAAEVEG